MSPAGQINKKIEIFKKDNENKKVSLIVVSENFIKKLHAEDYLLKVGIKWDFEILGSHKYLGARLIQSCSIEDDEILVY